MRRPGSGVSTLPAPRSEPVADRLIAQRGLFAGPSDLVGKDLYAAPLKGEVARLRDSVTLEPSTVVSGNTYFGRFPASYWQRWTTADEVTVELVVSGSGMLAVGASDARGEPRRVTTYVAAGAIAEPVRMTAKLDRFLDGGALWLEMETEAGQTLTVEQVRWTVAAPAQVRPTAVTICTMNRADDCMKNLRVLADDLESLHSLDAVYVIDQGTDTVASRDGFKQVKKDLRGRLRYLRQPNLGGSGGFARGMYEVAGRPGNERANVLFMDDDVLLEPDVVIRLTAFANRMAQPVIVGGQMLNLLHPHQLHVRAEYADLDALEPGKPVPHTGTSLDVLGRHDPRWPHREDRRVDAEYNGWWSCLIPAEVVAAVGYPLPLFFQWDDIEYAYRAKDLGFPTVTLPGAGVWHADFDWKDWDEWHRYFNLRNSIITAALHSRFDPLVLTRVLLAQLVRYLLGMQYGLAATLLKAVEDFLAGPGILADGGVAAMREIKRLRAEYPETECRDATDLPGVVPGGVSIVNADPEPSMPRAVLVKRVLYRVLGKHVHEIGQIPHDESHWWHASLFGTAVVTDASQSGVRVRRYDRARMVDLARRGVRVLNRLRREAPRVRDEYRAALPELTSRENWARLYGL